MNLSASERELYPVKPGRYPDSWKPRDKDDTRWKRAYVSHLNMMQQDYMNRGVLQAPLVQGESWLVPIQVPSPSHKGIDTKKKIVYVQKKEGKKILPLERIDLASFDTYKADGWKLWEPPWRPTEIPTDRDLRGRLPVLTESYPVSKSLKETALLFPEGIQISTICDGLDWHPGQLLGTNPNAEAPISKTTVFMLPSESGKNLASATSRGHIHEYDRPKFVGAGWGDYDLFFEWQLHGRVLDVKELEAKDWKRRDGETIKFVPASVPASVPARVLEDGEEVIMSSYMPYRDFYTPPPLYLKATGEEQEWKQGELFNVRGRRRLHR
ncbi:unnamed protein product [Clonostachys rhizophaga]|uniref:Uncharacterized protein n=1 Tax=Clonostachys rhizophaga TaxID=160324 RepID=A0A9N9YP22_9HYPO|nr:unnamed protein product [Clonostachys rhizophaga]